MGKKIVTLVTFRKDCGVVSISIYKKVLVFMCFRLINYECLHLVFVNNITAVFITISLGIASVFFDIA